MFSDLLAHSLRSCASFLLGRGFVLSVFLFTSHCVYSFASADISVYYLFRIVCSAHARIVCCGALNFAGGVGFRLAPTRKLVGCGRGLIVCASRVCYLFRFYRLFRFFAFARALAASPPNPPAALARSAPVPGRSCGCDAASLAMLCGVVTFFTCGCWALF